MPHAFGRITRLLLYSRAKQLMDYDIKLGYKSFNLEAVRAALLADKPVSQSDLNKIEWVMQYETMPPTRYTALHWAGKVSDEERAEILARIAKQRAEYYASNDTAPEHRNEPVQPIPQKLPTDAQKVALGFALYHDPRLSADSTISCAHCHALNAGASMAEKHRLVLVAQLGRLTRRRYLTQYLTLSSSGMVVRQHCRIRLVDRR